MTTRKLLTAAMLATGLAASAGPALAGPITGYLDISGFTTAHTSTSVTFSNPAGITNPLAESGSFTELGLCLSCVQMVPPTGTLSSTDTLPLTLFTATNNGATATLSVISDSFATIGAGGLQITGRGWVDLTNFDSTKASFSLTIPSSGPASFDLKTDVPEPATLALFGAGLLGCALFLGRRRRSTGAQA